MSCGGVDGATSGGRDRRSLQHSLLSTAHLLPIPLSVVTLVATGLLRAIAVKCRIANVLSFGRFKFRPSPPSAVFIIFKMMPSLFSLVISVRREQELSYNIDICTIAGMTD